MHCLLVQALREELTEAAASRDSLQRGLAEAHEVAAQAAAEAAAARDSFWQQASSAASDECQPDTFRFYVSGIAASVKGGQTHSTIGGLLEV